MFDEYAVDVIRDCCVLVLLDSKRVDVVAVFVTEVLAVESVKMRVSVSSRLDFPTGLNRNPNKNVTRNRFKIIAATQMSANIGLASHHTVPPRFSGVFGCRAGGTRVPVCAKLGYADETGGNNGVLELDNDCCSWMADTVSTISDQAGCVAVVRADFDEGDAI